MSPVSFFLYRSHLPWSLDASRLGIDEATLDALPWAAAFAEMKDLEAGSIANSDEGRQVGHYWLRAPEIAPTVGLAGLIGNTLNAARALAADIREGRVTNEIGETFTEVLHIGIGGSQLGPALLIDALAEDVDGTTAGLRIHFLDNTDPDGIQRTLGRLGDDLQRTLVLVISKSGSTPEPRNGLLLTQQALKRAGLNGSRHLVAITGDGSKLHTIATDEQWVRILPLWDWVGGRYSVTSAVGVLTAELAGIDTQALLGGARDMDAWTRTPRWRDNPAALLAGAWHQLGNGRGERTMVMLPYADRLVLLSRYLQQLVMESLGKEHDRQGNVVHQGLAVYGNKGSTDQHAYVQQLRDGPDDFFAFFVQVLASVGDDPELEQGVGAGDYLQGFLLGTRRALASTGHRSVTLTVPHVNPYTLGGIIALFERAVGLYASLVDINAYHQPGVEAGKKAASDVLDLSRSIRGWLAEHGASRLADISTGLGSDPTETLYVLQRLVLTDRVTLSPVEHTVLGELPDGSFDLARR